MAPRLLHPPRAAVAGRDVVEVRLEPLDGSPPWHAARYEAFAQVQPFTDDTPPGMVTGVMAEWTGNGIELTWDPVADAGDLARYQVHASTEEGFTPGEDTLVGSSLVERFSHTGLPLRTTLYYRLSARDLVGNTGAASDQASATSGGQVLVEAEDLLPRGSRPPCRSRSRAAAGRRGRAVSMSSSRARPPVTA